MKEIKEFMLPEHTNSLYNNEAISSISLTKEVAGKINELVNAYNELSRVDLNYKQEQEGKIRKAILYMKDNLVNSLQHLLDLLVENGFIDTRIMEQCKDLNTRLDNLLTRLEPGATTGDAELVDGRLGILSDEYKTIGESIRDQIKSAIMNQTGKAIFKNGTMNADDGKFVNVDNRLISTLLAKENLKFITCNSNYKLRFFYYDSQLSYVGASAWIQDLNVIDLDENIMFIRFILATSNDVMIELKDIDASGLKITTTKDFEKLGIKEYTNLPTVNATITTTGNFEHRTNRLMTRYIEKDFYLAYIKPGYFGMAYVLDENFNKIGGTNYVQGFIKPLDVDFPGSKYVYFITYKPDVDLTPEDDNGLILYTSNTKQIDSWNAKAPEFIHELLNIAYSSINLGLPNTKMHFDLSARFGFNALKGDVRITSDDELIMCHDASVYINNDGQITDGSTGTAYPILTNSWNQTLKDRTFKNNLGYLPGWSQHLCTFEEYIQLCVKHNKIAYITLRENKIQKVIELCMETLKKYNMLERCIFNSYEYEALQEVRKYSGSIPVSLVINHSQYIDATAVEKVACLGNGILTAFYEPGEIDLNDEYNSTGIAYAKERDIVLHMAQVDNYDDYIKYINAGFKGFHLLKPLQEHCVKYQLKFNFENNELKLINEDLTAELSNYAGEWGICNVRKINSELEYDDGFPLWLVIRNNPSLIVSTLDNNTANTQLYAYYDSAGGEISVVTGDYKGRFNLTLLI